MKTAFLILAAASTLATYPLVRAQSSGSLYDSRLGVIKGTSPGIVIFDSKRSPQPPAAAASSAPAAAASSASAAAGGASQPAARKADTPVAAAPTAPLAERAGALLRAWGDPPSGQPLNAAKRLDSPTQGITLPSASRAASQADGKAPPKAGG